MRARSHSIFPNALKRAFAILLMVVVAVTMIAAAPSPAPSKAPGASASPGVTTLPAAQQPDAPAVIGFLSQVIGWYRHLAIEEGLITDPAEMLFVSEDRQMADQVLNLSFEFAKAQAARLTAAQNEYVSGKPHAVAGATSLDASAEKADADIAAAQDSLEGRFGRTSWPIRYAKRDDLAPQIAAAQSELDLAEARGEAVHTIQQFEERQLPPGDWANGVRAHGQNRGARKFGTRGRAQCQNGRARLPAPRQSAAWRDLRATPDPEQELQHLDDTIDVTNALVQQVERMRAPMLDELRDIDTRATRWRRRAPATWGRYGRARRLSRS